MRGDLARLDGVVIGILLGFGESGTPLVIFPGNPRDEAVPALSTVALAAHDVGAEVALLFEGGDPTRPMVIGRLLRPASVPRQLPTADVIRDSEQLELRADREITLRCGKASITLTREGKILIRGAYISSWSSGANRIKGGSVHLN